MRKLSLLPALTMLLLSCGRSATADPWADEVISVGYGIGAGFGQDYFPGNVLGPPDPAATPTSPSADPTELLSLGSGGVIVLAFLDGGIEDGPGVDFTVFENPFIVGVDTNLVFRETGIVAVSEDGQSWFEFGWDPMTLTGLAGVTPVNGAAPLDPDYSGGDSFDLAAVGLDHANYLRITDSDGLVADDGDSFDLDAVAVLHGEQGAGHDLPAAVLTVLPNPVQELGEIVVELQQLMNVRITVVDLRGATRQLILSGDLPAGRTSVSWEPLLPPGIYFLFLTAAGEDAVTRVILL